MQTLIPRCQQLTVEKHLKTFSCVALLELRQVGKSTLAKMQDAQAFLEYHASKLICIDEVQRLPNLFPIFRVYLDQNNRPGQLLLLWAASRELISHSSESLAGRISYVELGPLVANEVDNLQRLLVQGGYPSSYLAEIEMSYEWRINYIRTFLERDIPLMGISLPAETLRRFWQMLAHLNGSLLNVAKLATSMGVSSPTIKKYLDILESAFMVRQLPPFSSNDTKKRLIKSPKIFIRDTGLTHALLGIENYPDLLGHPNIGTSFESMAMENILSHYPKYQPSFYRSSSGAEIDLVLEKGRKKIAIEIKASATPVLSQGFFEGLKVINPDQALVVAQISEPYPLKQDLWAYPMNKLPEVR